MLFNSYLFLLFYPVVTFIYFALKGAPRRAFLLTASCVFYMAFIPKYIVILFLTILVDYFAAIFIEKEKNKKLKKFYLVFSLVVTCLILFVFKYYNFFAVNLTALANALRWNYSLNTLAIILPIGLSFHTFQSMSYVIEVYRNEFRAERNFLTYALFVMFYPQLVAGPIERPQNLLHQFYENQRFNATKFREGLQLVLWGLFKKVVIADRLAVIVDEVYNKPSGYGSLASLIATICFAYQIYCDFSGYSDIARGIAKTMGFELMVNFNFPYRSRSVSEFWRRWHISLSTWFKDYLYLPLGGNRVSRLRQSTNLMITFLVSGLWHGANWTYLIWGGLNGTYIVAEKYIHQIAGHLFGRRFKLFRSAAGWLITFILICLAWVFFRANNATEGFTFVQKILKLPFDSLAYSHDIQNITQAFKDFTVFTNPKDEFNLAILSIFILGFFEKLQKNPDNWSELDKAHPLIRWTVVMSLVLAVINFGVTHEKPFIYFQF